MTDIFPQRKRSFGSAGGEKRAGKGSSTRRASLRSKFDGHSRRWREQTWFMSDTQQASEHKEYQAIIAMGRTAIPYILKDLESGSLEHWFIALKSITGEDPVPAKDQGKIDRMAAAWMAWGKRNGYVG